MPARALRLVMADPGTPSRYVPGTHPDLPPPVRTSGVIGWARENLFSSPFNVILTLLGAWFLVSIIPPFVEWAFVKSVWVADTRNECWGKMEVPEGAACWAFIKAKVNLFIYGFYPLEERWRAHVSFVLLVLAIIPVLYDRLPGRKHWMWYVAVFPFLVGWLLVGGFGLPHVDSDQIGGFLLTLVIGVTGISFSLPIGIALALGRTSNLPAVRILCVLFIEFIRGVPLITLLFVASTMLNYFLPPGTTFDLLMRVLIMVTLFSSAYIAEVVRGGLQGVPRGQAEAADSLGLSYWKAQRLIVLPRRSRSRSPASSTPSSGSTRTPPWCSSSACSTPSASAARRSRTRSGRGSRARCTSSSPCSSSCAASGCRATRSTSSASSTRAATGKWPSGPWKCSRRQQPWTHR